MIRFIVRYCQVSGAYPLCPRYRMMVAGWVGCGRACGYSFILN